jgi:filamentous hemagglutinin family protein
MNHIYRLCWNRSLSQWVPASELAQSKRGGMSRGNVVGHRVMMLSLLSASLGMTGLAHAGNAPTGGQIVSGSGQIQQSGNTTTIQQNSKVLSLNWQSFDVGADQTVNFLQPGASSIAVNRILGNTASEIFGHLNANGQVWLINPNGVLFGQGAQVNVGGIVASTLDLDDSTLGSNTVRFSGDGKGKVINQGSITTANGGYAALIGNQVSNQGVIRAQLGTVALGGGSAVTLTFGDNHLLHLAVDKSTLNNLAENRQLIVADGGQVLMTAGARDSLLASAVNNTGTVQARSVENHDGVITLLGGMEAGTVNVGGTLDASAPNGGNGGQIETSAANFKLATDAKITAAAPHGNAGTWLVDPVDLTIDSAAATTISSTLNGGTNVTEQTTATGSSGAGVVTAGNGDININAAISWNNSAAVLELDAFRNINVNALVNGGSGGGVVMNAVNGTLTIGNAGGLSAGGGVTVGANTFANSAGAGALGSKWSLYTVKASQNTLGGLTPNFIQYGTSFQGAAQGTGNGLFYSTAATLKITGLTGTVSKVYDNTNAASFTGANFTSTGLADGDKIASATGGTYASVNAGSNISVTSPGAIGNFSITDSTGAIPVFGYTLSGSPMSAKVGQITPATLTAQIIGNPTKVYDGTTTATLSSGNYEIDGFVAGQGATVKQPSSIAYAGSDAGSVALNATFSVTNFTANAGTNFANYILPTVATGLGTINPAPLLISGLLGTSKIYDGNTSDAINTSGAKLFGVIQPDLSDVQLDTSGATGTFAQANVANGIGITASGFVLTGNKAHNYVLQAPTGLSANITPKQLTIDQVIANNKTYDNTLAATLNTTNAALSGVVGTDNVTLSSAGATASFGQTDVGSNLAVTTSGFALGGSAAGNYALSQPSLFASITPAVLTITMTGTPTKTYDGTNAVTLGGSNFNVTGFVSGQGATVAQSSASYASPNAGTGITVTATLQPSDFAPNSGTSLSNYTFLPTVTGTGLGTINPLQLTGQIVNNPTKVYDGNTNASLTGSNFTLVGLLSGQSISIDTHGTAPGTYDDPNAGARGVSSGALPVGDFTAGGGTLLSNYILPTTYLGSGSIMPAPLTGSFTVLDVGIVNASKVYDGLLTITLHPANFTLSGFVNGDSATVTSDITGTFGQKNVGTDIPLSANMSTSDLTAGSGTNLGNYAINSPVLGIGNITPAQLTVSIIGNPTKTYNGSTNVALTSGNFSVAGWVHGENGTINPSASAGYDSANASAVNGRIITATLTPGNYVLDAGTLLSNYNVDLTATGTGTINQAPLFVTGVFAKNKVYDATTTASLNTGAAGLAGLVDTDTGNVTLDLSSVVANFSQKNVGSGLAVSASGFSITGSEAANYILQPVTGLFANITKATLTLSGVSANSKTYDGNADDTLTIAGTAALNGIIGSDTVGFDATGASGLFSTANAGNNLKVTTSGFALTGGDAGNYQLTQPTGLTASINPKQLTAVITGSPTKVYDGTNSATLTASDYDLQGFIAGQGASIPQSATANYVTKNVGTGLGVASTLVTSDFVANSGTDLSNYILPTTGAGNNGVIQPKVIDLTGTRVYDSTPTASAALFGTLAGVNGETLTVTGQGTLVDKNVGDQKAFAALGTLALANGGNGGLASNYTLVGGTDWVTITPASLTATFTANNKTYDATNAATLTGPAVLSGLLGSDNVTLNNPTDATFSNKNAGVGKTVTGNMSISGIDAGNYIFTQGTTTATISQLHITATATGKDKQYDATTTDSGATVGSGGVLAGDTVNFGFGAANFDDKNVGNNKNVTVTGITSSGTDAANYVVDNTSANTTANITPRVINLTGTRVYDANTDADANLFAPGGNLSTGFGGEVLNLSGAGVLNNKNVGNQKAFANLGTLALADGSNGGLASNYTLVGGTDWVTVTKATLNYSFTAANKTYDGTNSAVLSNQVLTGLLSGDSVTPINPGAGHFSDKNVGTNKTVTGDMTFGGADIGNYNVVVATTTANIAALGIDVTALGINKVYDGTVNAAVDLSSLGIKGGDQVSFSGTSVFSDKNVGNNKNVSVSGIVANGADAGNYTLNNTTTTTTANITPVILNLQSTRVYDGTTSAAASLFADGANQIAGINGETVTLTGNAGVLLTKNVGTQQAFANLGDLALADGTNGGAAGNYSLVGGTDWVTITPKALTATTSVNGRVYDGTNIIALNGSALSGLVVGDNVTLGNDTQGTFADKNVGNNKAVTTHMTVSGTDAGNYTFTQPTGLAADVTPLAITVGAAAQNKIYDTTTTAVITSLTGNGVLSGDVVNFGYGTADFSDANAANSKTVTVNGITKSGTDAGNYTINTVATTTANITPVVLDLSGTRVYDGSTRADANLFGSNGVLAGIAGQTINLTGSGVAGSKNVGSNVPFGGLGTLALSDGGNGGLASNYTLVGGTDTLTITPKTITIGATGDNKVYDTTTAATVALAGSGVIGGDDISFTPGSATFVSPNAGNSIGINVTGITASGADAGNYSFVNTATTAANITPVVLDLSGTRVYDGTANADASLFGSNGVLTGIAGQTLNLSGNGVLGNKNVGNNKPFSGLGTLALGDGGNGGLAQNYTLIGGNDAVTVTPKTITVDATGSNKTYDGNTTANVGLSGNGVIGGDQISFTPGSANYASPNAGNGIGIAVNGISGSGADAGNYAFNTSATTSGNITPVVLDLTGTRTYDGTTGAAGNLFGNNGVLTGVNGETLTLTGTGTVSDKNVGSQKAFANGGLSGFTLTGNGSALGGNYTLTGGTDWLTITPATLTVIGTQTSNRVYDGTRIDALSGSMLSGLFGNDDVTLGNTATGLFDTKNVGNDKTVTTAMTISGGDMGNYILVQPTGLTADVTPRPVTITATGTDKMFDGNTKDKVTLSSNGVLGGDQVSFAETGANFSDPNVGNGKTVTVTGITGSGADAGNYVVVDPTTTTTANITGAQASAFGVDDGLLAQLQGAVGPSAIATPYGVADQDVVGSFTGNQKKEHRPNERNRARTDFNSGLALKVVDGGVQMPVNALP